MKLIIVFLALIFWFSPSLSAAVQTDTHTYIVCSNDNVVLAIDRKTGAEKIIAVGKFPISIGIPAFLMSFPSIL